MTNPFGRRSTLGVGERIFVVVLGTILIGLLGGVALMWLSDILLPVGLGFWASASAIVLGRVVFGAITVDFNDDSR